MEVLMETLEQCRERIATIRKQIVEGESRGEDTNKLVETLKRARLEEKAIQDAEINNEELAELRTMAVKRVEWQKAAQSIQDKAKAQNDAVARFLQARDGVTAKLQGVIELLQPLIVAQESCYKEFADAASFNSAAGAIPKGFLSDVTCSRLAMKEGKTLGLHLSQLSLVDDLLSWRELLDNIIKVQDTVTGNIEINHETLASTNDTETTAFNCSICQHPQIEAINADLKAGELSLREIESKYPGVSRSSLSRHEQKHIISQEIKQEVHSN